IVFNQRPDFDFLKVKQTHSDTVISYVDCASGDIPADGIAGDDSAPKAILTADCVPLVLIGKDEHVVIHAGWRGLAQNILNHELVQKIKPNYAFIGPHIRPEHYEVQSDFLANFPNNLEAFSNHHGKTYFNLAQVAVSQLKNAYPGIVVEDCGLCTFHEQKFHSYRRDKTIQRNWNIYFPL
ncbi:MAG: polyphenol oxidase family protein, partial [Bdellovibrionales bacterium]|nr:polyphenol oxidase family protein [Bdellovibrionales bacterium]